jgi:hypothetical protein
MATILLSAAGAAAGASLGGSVLGLSSVVIGRAMGATLGRALDQAILGAGSEPVEQGRVEQFRLTGAGEGRAVPCLFGRLRLAGQVIWASDFVEEVTVSGSGKGVPSGPKTEAYSYSVSLAIALCEGEIGRVGRIWADGAEIAPADLNLRVYTGSEDQLPDPKIEAVEGAGMAPAYRGIAYVVIEDLALGPYGNRVPQFSFEVVRPAPAGVPDVARAIEGVALIPGTGEYALATTPVYVTDAGGGTRAANLNSASGKSDLETALDALTGEVPNCGSVSLVVSWFGDDLRAGRCSVRPRVERADVEAADMPWSVSGQSRAEAGTVPETEAGPVYGGTPTDLSVIEGIAALNAAGQSVVFYPFLLMEQMDGNMLTDPWTAEAGQPPLPWRGRITTELAPGLDGTPDGTAAAEAEVAAFFGSAAPGDFTVTVQGVDYTGPAEMSYRRFILHYAQLCAAAGGVDGFCIGSEMRSLTQIRGAGASFPAVQAFRQLAADVRAILGAGVKLGYAADWSEYFGYHPQDGSGDVYFHLDPLWADPEIDFIGIDNYMPLSDWRDGDDHADAGWGSIYDLDYLRGNVAGGEGYDWYYHAPEARAAQNRTPITDGAYGEPWVFRYKDLLSWWSNDHHDRPDGVRVDEPTGWVPRSKPIWFTEFGCPAVDKGTNQPNVFLDPKSSESALPRHSNGRRDDLIQRRYLAAVLAHWAAPENNPISEIYGGPMVDMARAHVWAWDARPYPWFPGNAELWNDAENWTRGHWITGRITARDLGQVVTEVCAGSGVETVETGALYGLVRGYAVADLEGARAALQPLMLAHGFDAVEREGALVLRSRDGKADRALTEDDLAVLDDGGGDLVATRVPEAETMGRVKIGYVLADGAYETATAEAIFPDEASFATSFTDLPMALTRFEAAGIAERWLAEARVARDRLRLALPPALLGTGAGDVVALNGRNWRIDRVELSGKQVIEAVRVESAIYEPSDAVETAVRLTPFVAPVPVQPVFLDLPLLTGDEVEHAPHLAVTASPWPGSVAVYESATDENFALNIVLAGRAVIGVTETPLFRAPPALYDHGPALRVRLSAGSLQSVGAEQLLAGANALAIGSGSDDLWEVFQFADAVLVGPETYELSTRLRGQLGTDALMPADWPVGSTVVLLNGAVEQIELPSSQRRVARTYRIGPAERPMDDPVYRELRRAFDGVGLRPYAPVHLAVAEAGGELHFNWTRRTRIEGDSWDQLEVPLGEAFESYMVRILDGASVLREVILSSPSWAYSAAEQAEDGHGGVFRFEVAQISDRFGPGLFAGLDVGG